MKGVNNLGKLVEMVERLREHGDWEARDSVLVQLAREIELLWEKVNALEQAITKKKRGGKREG